MGHGPFYIYETGDGARVQGPELMQVHKPTEEIWGLRLRVHLGTRLETGAKAPN